MESASAAGQYSTAAAQTGKLSSNPLPPSPVGKGICRCSMFVPRGWVRIKQKTGAKTKLLLETIPVHKLVDIFVATFEISFEEQLSMLDSIDVKVRISKAAELVDRHLQFIHEFRY
ncbi:hypothetical protein Vadar_027545 [Vaccinium darrowii]|uniref:Uncharacterized protein n=1 Tax=Vaccinium darrowii TaxID=229202 RepID=A0ACB7YQA9_9ERIC|nr:hypothetical protein Vadar_027545 [Vaccinium darrowii]